MITNGNNVKERTEENERIETFNGEYSSAPVSDDFSVYNDSGYETERLLNESAVSEEVGKYEGANDATPSPTTMQFFDPSGNVLKDSREEADDEVETGFKITPRGKALIAIYSIVVATIIALIIMNAKVLKNMRKTISEEERVVESLAQKSQVLDEELEYVSSEAVIAEKAVALGMSK
ncbi:MAG: hypothetical protein IJU84_04645 [Clostridia bacterium]|nr:hypothetical protein [Clostridia bacterium]MBQ9481433.1 hypothetical protein [Clostridia bacterium]